jgi:hypothetical protein
MFLRDGNLPFASRPLDGALRVPSWSESSLRLIMEFDCEDGEDGEESGREV